VTSSRLRGQLRGDLDTIALMALRKEPARLGASAEAFGADIQRYLSVLPVLARRDTLAYRATKIVRRHAWGVGATALANAALSAATIMLASQRAELVRQRDALTTANTKLTVSNTQALESSQFLQNLISSADVGEKGPPVRLADVLRDAAALLGAADRDAEAVPALERAIASLEALQQPPAGLLKAAREALLAAYERVGEEGGKRDALREVLAPK
jgi:hypothetical protein